MILFPLEKMSALGRWTLWLYSLLTCGRASPFYHFSNLKLSVVTVCGVYSFGKPVGFARRPNYTRSSLRSFLCEHSHSNVERSHLLVSGGNGPKGIVLTLRSFLFHWGKPILYVSAGTIHLLIKHPIELTPERTAPGKRGNVRIVFSLQFPK